VRTIAWLVFAAACSGGSGTPTRPSKPAPVGTTDAGVAVAPALTAAECEQLVTHAVDLALRERTPAADPPPSDPEKTKIDEPLRSFATECAPLTRESYRCGMDATTLAALSACHATLRSSTSNSRVAPPGITPPAPRSP
jgi:hypothetical protein